LGTIEWRKVLDDAWLLALNGVHSIAFGAILVARGAGSRVARLAYPNETIVQPLILVSAP
jgi:hypothetical protein